MKKNAVLVVVEEEVIRDAVLRKSQAYDRWSLEWIGQKEQTTRINRVRYQRKPRQTLENESIEMSQHSKSPYYHRYIYYLRRCWN